MMITNPDDHDSWLPIWICCLSLLITPIGALSAQERHDSSEARILQFQVLPTTEDGVQWHTFHWDVANTMKVKLFQDGSEIPGRSQLRDGSVGWPLSMSGALRMRLKAPATFKLVATDRAGHSVSQIQRSEVGNRPPTTTSPPADATPRILSFRATPTTIERGGSVAFSWEVETAQSIRLFEGDHEVDLRGLERTLSTGGHAVFSTTIDETTTFRLTASDHNRRATSKSITVRVERTAEPVGTCDVHGQLTGRWQQQVQEHPTDPASTWTVAVYAFVDGSDRPAAHASVSSEGTYQFRDLIAGKRYRIKPNWDAVPRQVHISCRAGQTQKGPPFRVTGRPLID